MFHVFTKITNICVHSINASDYVVKGLIKKVGHYLPHRNINDWSTSVVIRFVDNNHFQTLIPVDLPRSISVKVLSPSKKEAPIVDVEKETDLQIGNVDVKWEKA